MHQQNAAQYLVSSSGMVKYVQVFMRGERILVKEIAVRYILIDINKYCNCIEYILLLGGSLYVNQTINGRNKFVSAGIVSYGGNFFLIILRIFLIIFPF